MMNRIRTLGLALASLIALAGCQSSSASILGTWQGQSAFDGVPYTDRMTFSGDEMGGAFSGTAFGTDPSFGCRITFNYMGNWSLSADDTLVMEYTFASDSATGCTDPLDDYPETPYSAAELTTLNAGIGGAYELTDATLVVRVSGTATTYTRQ